MYDLFKPRIETLSRRARRALHKEGERQEKHPLLGRDSDKYAVNTVMLENNLTADTNASPSPAIWGWCPRAEWRDDPSKGYIFKPDLYNAPVFATTVSQMGLISLQDTGVTIQGDPTQPGVLQWGGQDADNDCGVLTSAGGVGTTFNISTTDQRKLAFEVGLRKSVITNNSMAFFAGLTEEAMNAATNTLLATDTAALGDKDLIGFHVTQAAGSTVTFVYNKAGAGGVTVKIASLATMVAATWIKLGFLWDPDAPADKRIKIFVNNICQSTYVTGANVAAATFPNGEELVPTLAFKKGEATISTADVRLWECAQKISA